MLAQQRLGDGDAPLAESGGRLEQPRVARRGPDVISVGRIRGLRVAHDREVIAEHPPGIRQVGLQAHRPTQRRDRGVAFSSHRTRATQLEVRKRPVGLRLHERLKHTERPGDVGDCPFRLRQDQGGVRMIWHDLQNLVRLLYRERWVA